MAAVLSCHCTARVHGYVVREKHVQYFSPDCPWTAHAPFEGRNTDHVVADQS